LEKKNACDEKKAGKKCVFAMEPPCGLSLVKAIHYVGKSAAIMQSIQEQCQ
jgi:hypothetical protein